MIQVLFVASLFAGLVLARAIRSARISRLIAAGYAKIEAAELSKALRTYRHALHAESKLIVQFAHEPNGRHEVIQIALNKGYDPTAAAKVADLLPSQIVARIVGGEEELFDQYYAKLRLALDERESQQRPNM
jgi:hypothetical protein